MSCMRKVNGLKMHPLVLWFSILATHQNHLGELLKVLMRRSPSRPVNSNSLGGKTQTTVMCLSDLGRSSVQPSRELMISRKVSPTLMNISITWSSCFSASTCTFQLYSLTKRRCIIYLSPKSRGRKAHRLRRKGWVTFSKESRSWLVDYAGIPRDTHYDSPIKQNKMALGNKHCSKKWRKYFKRKRFIFKWRNKNGF